MKITDFSDTLRQRRSLYWFRTYNSHRLKVEAGLVQPGRGLLSFAWKKLSGKDYLKMHVRLVVILITLFIAIGFSAWILS